MVLLEMAIFPNNVVGSLSPYVARVMDIIDKSGLKYRLSPMSTVIEGELEQVLALATQCHNELAKDCNRISIVMRVDSKPGNNETRMESKVTAVEEKVGRKLVTTIS
ncbi:MTH1187 family thiamine-binding protein [Oxalobacter vibrioformis]|uniref:MTH1187 family thiamine-binding protein n=1 Tax=Oxalobacter vibrioformis TaxID=933080 RepID=A0A9E9LX69_9BURK|nr:MTH1187 family thiamine-binding protein [Oxalobacter vibrioformis]NLC24184.1 MTH1187 family thiamine-binding protein [Oxalobacter sp.]WAW10519.1 MTH1187 family thiamine-binding protein [Oxalobacter vibrioformis]